jgi:hypothetical protein
VLGQQLLEGVETGLGVRQLAHHQRPADVVDDRHCQGVFVGVDAGEHADSFLLDSARKNRCPGAVHALAGCRSRRSYQASTAQDIGERHRRALIAEGHCRSRRAARRRASPVTPASTPPIDDGAAVVQQVQDVCGLVILTR